MWFIFSCPFLLGHCYVFNYLTNPPMLTAKIIVIIVLFVILVDFSFDLLLCRRSSGVRGTPLHPLD